MARVSSMTAKSKLYGKSGKTSRTVAVFANDLMSLIVALRIQHIIPIQRSGNWEGLSGMTTTRRTSRSYIESYKRSRLVEYGLTLQRLRNSGAYLTC